MFTTTHSPLAPQFQRNMPFERPVRHVATVQRGSTHYGLIAVIGVIVVTVLVACGMIA